MSPTASAMRIVFITVLCCVCFFFFNDTATTEIYTLSLHDALPISMHETDGPERGRKRGRTWSWSRSEEHTSELQSRLHLVCRLLLEKKKNTLEIRSDKNKSGHQTLATLVARIS